MGWFSDLLDRIFGHAPKPPKPVPAPVPPGPGPVPVPLVRQLTRGRVILDVQGTGRLPLSADRDDLVLAVLSWTSPPDTAAPILGIHVRGKSPADAGFLLRWSPCLHEDQEIYEQHGAEAEEKDLYYGSGQNFHQRKPVADGRWTVEWDEQEIRVSSPKATQKLKLRVPGSAGFGAISTHLWARGEQRYHLWSGFEAGASVKVLEWAPVGDQPALVRVP